MKLIDPSSLHVQTAGLEVARFVILFPSMRSVIRQRSASSHSISVAATGPLSSPLAGGARAELIEDDARIVSLQPLLMQIGVLAGESHDAEDLVYLLSTTDPRNKRARLLLLPAEDGEASVMGFSAAVLLFEYTLPFGLDGIFGGSKVYASFDLTGRRAVFAPRLDRARVAARAARFLIENGDAHIVHIAFSQAPDDPSSTAVMEDVVRGDRTRRGASLWCVAETKIKEYLQLGPTFEQTLARIGPRTRYNLKYYRRRTERDLGCTYVPDVQITLEDFLSFNRGSMFPRSDAIAREQYEAMVSSGRPFLAGIKDREGQWLGVIGGRRRTREIEVDFQLNRSGFELYSLSTVLRCCLIDHEAMHGSTRLYFHDGTKHRMGSYFVDETLSELTVRRRSWYAGMLIRLVRRFQPEKNPVAEIVSDRAQVWQRW